MKSDHVSDVKIAQKYLLSLFHFSCFQRQYANTADLWRTKIISSWVALCQSWKCSSQTFCCESIIDWQTQIRSLWIHHCICPEATLPVANSQPMAAQQRHWGRLVLAIHRTPWWMWSQDSPSIWPNVSWHWTALWDTSYSVLCPSLSSTQPEELSPPSPAHSPIDLFLGEPELTHLENLKDYRRKDLHFQSNQNVLKLYEGTETYLFLLQWS